MKILLVDDSRMMRTVLRRVLEQTGLEISEIQEAGDGSEGYEMAVRLLPDLVLTDVNMPHVDGLQMLKMIKANPATSKIAVIVVSTEGGEQVINEVMGSGAASYLLKPFTGEQLVEALSTAGLIAAQGMDA